MGLAGSAPNESWAIIWAVAFLALGINSLRFYVQKLNQEEEEENVEMKLLGDLRFYVGKSTTKQSSA